MNQYIFPELYDVDFWRSISIILFGMVLVLSGAVTHVITKVNEKIVEVKNKIEKIEDLLSDIKEQVDIISSSTSKTRTRQRISRLKDLEEE